MNRPVPIRWYNRIPIARKLYFTVGIMAVLILFELIVLLMAINTLSAIRAYISSEGVWSKAQKNAIYQLRKYARSCDFEDYRAYLRFMRVPQAIRNARQELIKLKSKQLGPVKLKPDLSIVRQGLIAGGSHPDDINTMMRLYSHFQFNPHIKKAFTLWEQADSSFAQLMPVGEDLHSKISSFSFSQQEIFDILSKLDYINDNLIEHENEFSYILGAGSRWFERFILILVVIVVLSVEIIGILFSFSLNKSIHKGLNEINRASRFIAKGDFSTRVLIYSKDEIGELAGSFNRMTNELEQNITARKEAEKKQIEYDAKLRAEEKFRLVLEAAPNALIVVSREGIITLVNKQTEKLFGYTREELIGQPSEILVPARYRNKYPFYRNVYFDNPVSRGMGIGHDFLGVDKNGREFPAEVGLSPIVTDDGIMVLSSIVDITERRKNENALREAKEKAEELSRAKQEFLSIMSHDIRTPLNAVLAITRMMMEENPKKSQLDQLTTLKFSADNLLGLINNVLDFSKIEAGKIQFEKINFNIRYIVTGIINSFSFVASEKQLQLKSTIDKDIPEIITGDPVRLSQILNNLINNAIKFTEAGSISLNVRLISVNNVEVELLFEVIDTGVGIEKSRQEQIFEWFTQAHSYTTRKYGGTGLGLTICKRLVELLGGRIFVESEVKKGTAFRFNLRFLKSAAPAGVNQIEPTHPGKSELKGVKILLVEDNPTNQALTKKTLSKWGASVDCANNGKAAVEKVKSKKYDLVLMDLQMPIMDGFEANEAIRKAGYSFDVLPIIALTAFGLAEDKSKVFEAGMNDYISKPIYPNELYQKIIKSIRNKLTARDEFAVEQSWQDEIVSLKNIIESSKDDPGFIIKYLKLFEKEFSELHFNLSVILKQKDIKSLSKLIHKITPSIQRLENTSLQQQLYQIRELLSDNDSTEKDFENLMEEIKKSCDEAMQNIRKLKNENSGL